MIITADEFAKAYRELFQMGKQLECQVRGGMTKESLEETLKFREFKTSDLEGIFGGEIVSVILPLLADHVLREANHYIRMLECQRMDEWG